MATEVRTRYVSHGALKPKQAETLASGMYKRSQCSRKLAISPSGAQRVTLYNLPKMSTIVSHSPMLCPVNAFTHSTNKH